MFSGQVLYYLKHKTYATRAYVFSGLQWAVWRHKGVPEGVRRGELRLGRAKEERLGGRVYLDVSLQPIIYLKIKAHVDINHSVLRTTRSSFLTQYIYIMLMLWSKY